MFGTFAALIEAVVTPLEIIHVLATYVVDERSECLYWERCAGLEGADGHQTATNLQ